MRALFQTSRRDATKVSEPNLSRRRELKRLAILCCALTFGAALFASGCRTTKNHSSKTVDDFLQADKPQW